MTNQPLEQPKDEFNIQPGPVDWAELCRAQQDEYDHQVQELERRYRLERAELQDRITPPRGRPWPGWGIIP